MISHDVYTAASQIGVSLTLPELECDIDAQIKALLDEDHPKSAVFLARGNSLGTRKLPSWIFVESRAEGTLLTNSATVAAIFRNKESVTDRDLAGMLGYPEAKADVIDAGEGVVVQALDKSDCIVFEAAASQPRLQETLDAAERQVPPGGSVHVISIEHALSRRISGILN